MNDFVPEFLIFVVGSVVVISPPLLLILDLLRRGGQPLTSKLGIKAVIKAYLIAYILYSFFITTIALLEIFAGAAFGEGPAKFALECFVLLTLPLAPLAALKLYEKLK